MKRFPLLVLCLLFLVIDAGVARAITVIDRDFDQLVARADTVFKGLVTTRTSQWIGEGPTRRIVTDVTFRVEDTYKGASAPEQTLRFLGGTVGDETMEIPDMPQFATGQEAILFVVNNGKQFCPLVGIAQGRFHVVKETGTGQERVFTNDGSPVVNTAEIGKVDEAGIPRLHRYAHTSAQAMTTEDFKSEILGKVATIAR